MGRRNSGYERKANDFYATPPWVTRALIPHLPRISGQVWEPAAGDGAMARVLSEAGYNVICSDLHLPKDAGSLWPNKEAPSQVRVPGVGPIWKRDFLDHYALTDPDAIITNPPFSVAQQFVERAIELTAPRRGVVAMLLSTDWGHARSRKHLFSDCKAYWRKVELTKRIVWFVEPDGKPKAQPSTNHAWFIWDHRNEGAPTIRHAGDTVE